VACSLTHAILCLYVLEELSSQASATLCCACAYVITAQVNASPVTARERAEAEKLYLRVVAREAAAAMKVCMCLSVHTCLTVDSTVLSTGSAASQ
jgi:hypothetical protein